MEHTRLAKRYSLLHEHPADAGLYHHPSLEQVPPWPGPGEDIVPGPPAYGNVCWASIVRLLAALTLAVLLARCSAAAPASQAPASPSGGMPPAFGTGICKIVGDSRALAPKLQALSDAAQAHDLAKASDAATNVKAAVTLIQAQIDQLAPWPDGQVAVRRLTETMDGFQESMNLFITAPS